MLETGGLPEEDGAGLDDALESLLRSAFTPPPPPLREPASEESLAHYRLIREIARGGQGVVHLAEDTKLRRRVAVKALTAAAGLSEEARSRFDREARIVSRLDHPGICRVLDFGVHEDIPFLVLPFVEGESLAERLDAAKAAGDPCVRLRPELKPSLGALLLFFEKAAEALHAAHEAGVIHRDLKPGNLMVTPGGEPVLLDFGVVRDVTGGNPTLTRTGEAFGTPAYMSPEQLRPGAAPPDRRADVYALGVTIYECLTLRRPFEAVSRVALHREILTRDNPDPRAFNREVPRDLAMVLLKAMEKEPGRRYETARELADELRRVRERRPILARPAGPAARLAKWARRERALAATLASIFLGLGAALGVSLSFLAETRAAVGRAQEARRTAGAETRRADAAAREALRTLGEYERLADIRRLRDLLREQREDLWPAVPGKIKAMEAWLERTRELTARLPEHRSSLEALRARAARGPGEAPRDSLTFADARDQWRHDLQALFVKDLEALLADDPKGETIRSVEERGAFASTVRRRTVEDEKESWARAIEAVARDPRFGGLRLVPQVGLVPIGPDPRTGLQEFWHLQTGGRPERDVESGRIQLTDEAGLVLVLLPGGSFTMGAQAGDPRAPNHDPFARPEEAPVHPVTLCPFFLSKYEMNQAQWLRIAGSNPGHMVAGFRLVAGPVVTLLHPVERMSFDEARDMLRHSGLELPTEAQWEYACRAGTSTPWWTGSEKETLSGAANLADRAAAREGARWKVFEDWPTFDDGWPVHAPVDAHRPNPFGLHGLIGNVEEWCADPAARYGGPVRACDGLQVDTGEYRVARGGSYKNSHPRTRSAARSSHKPDFKDVVLGFRPARGLED